MALIKCPECKHNISSNAINCPHCGFPLREAQKQYQIRQQEKKNITPAKKHYKILPIAILLILLLGIFYLYYCSAALSEDQKNNNTLTARESEPNKANETVTSTNIGADISDFDYSISEDNTVMLERYKGKDSTLKIESQFNIDNQSYKTDLSNFQIHHNSVTTFIVSDGITELNDSIFNGCNVEKIYFPDTLTVVYDNTLAYLSGEHIDIYYEGTQSDWDTIFTAYQPKSTSEEWKSGNAKEAGKAFADKLNSYIGHEYDDTKFTYHFESSIDDIVQ